MSAPSRMACSESVAGVLNGRVRYRGRRPLAMTFAMDPHLELKLKCRDAEKVVWSSPKLRIYIYTSGRPPIDAHPALFNRPRILQKVSPTLKVYLLDNITVHHRTYSPNNQNFHHVQTNLLVLDCLGTETHHNPWDKQCFQQFSKSR
jgi:hypothetical protein